MDATITGLTTEQAYYIVDSINPDAAHVSGVGEDEVTISPEGLGELGALDEHADGHFDGRYVWIGGTEYTVRGI
jgi:hypothetical protein